MALIFTEGFDAYGTSAEAETLGKWLDSGGYNNNLVAGFYGGQAYQLTSHLGATPEARLNVAPGTLVAGIRYRLGGQPTQTTELISLLESTSNVMQLKVSINSAGNLEVANGDNVLLGTANGFPINTWVYIEIKVTFDPTAGSVVMRWDGSEVLNLTNVDTVDNSSANHAADRLRFSASSAANWSKSFDDIYVLDTTGTVNNDFLGDVYIETLRPTADSAVAWSRSGGTTNAENVDETAHDGDTTYVFSTTAAQQDLYDFGVLTNADTVFAVVPHAVSRKTTAGTRKLKLLTKAGVDEQASVDLLVWSDYKLTHAIFETKNGTNAWTPADVDGAQFGFELV